MPRKFSCTLITILVLFSGMASGRYPIASSMEESKKTETPWPVRMADSIMKRHPMLPPRWDYTNGVVLKGIEQVWITTKDKKYFDYIKSNIDSWINANGEIKNYRVDEYNLDQINSGKLLFTLYAATHDEKYRKALSTLRLQLAHQPRTSEGGYWHKLIYPYQMWLDGIYMGSPFYAEYGQVFNEPEDFDDVAKQIILIAKYTRDPKTGLFYHGWDESKVQRWSNPKTGLSSNFWGRAMGWYAMAIVDALDYIPLNHPRRQQIISIFKGMMTALASVQDKPTGLWYQVLDQGTAKGNYLEASASSMFVYAAAKGIRKGYLDKSFMGMVESGFKGIITHLIEVDKEGLVNLKQCNEGSGLGGYPRYRDGSYDYYINEPVIVNDHKATGSFILAAIEMEALNK